ncbi:AI-2E family transporter [Thalassotalea litorea]|uniref:AI-2E family transporter n=1 Tax=Thalassotalea litorea TaxID=2020715 RepID=A0A5R9IRF8_9GAMM|nr:AI-2E family transporter [Thalassotalea litorea]TLU68115.1 AI-2E family transporter [Thalassotalea litorea]
MGQANQGQPSDSGVVRGLFVLALLVIIMAGVKVATNLLVPFLLSIFIAIACNPLVNKAVEWRVPKVLAVLVVIGLFFGAGFLITGLLGNSLNELSASMPTYKAQVTEKFSGLIDTLASNNIRVSKSFFMQYLDPGAAMGFAADMLSSFGNIMANLFFIILTVVFMLLEASTIPTKLHLAFQDPQMKMAQIDKFLSSVNQYLAIKTVVSIGTGICVSTMLWAFGLDFYLLWGVVAFLFNFIPNIGSIIAAVPAVLLALVQLNPAMAGFIGLGYIIINTVMGNIVEPKYLGRGLGLSTLVVFLSLVFWGWLLGTVGMLLSVPLTMIIKIALENSAEGQWFSVLLSDSDRLDSQVEQLQQDESLDDETAYDAEKSDKQ